MWGKNLFLLVLLAAFATGCGGGGGAAGGTPAAGPGPGGFGQLQLRVDFEGPAARDEGLLLQSGSIVRAVVEVLDYPSLVPVVAAIEVLRQTDQATQVVTVNGLTPGQRVVRASFYDDLGELVGRDEVLVDLAVEALVQVSLSPGPIEPPIVTEPREYVLATEPDALHVFSVDLGTGSLSPVQELMLPGLGLDTVTASPDGRFVYVSARLTDQLLQFSLDPQLGTLTQVGTFATGDDPNRGTFSVDGDFFFQPNQGDQTVTVFSFDPVTGAMSEVFGSPFGFLPGAPNFGGAQMAFAHPGGEFLFLGNGTITSYIMHFMIDQVTGALSQPTEFLAVPLTPFVSRVFDIKSHPAGDLLYITGSPFELYLVDFDPNTGALASRSNLPLASQLGEMELDPAHGLLHVALFTTGQVQTLSIDANGDLTPVATIGSGGTEPLLMELDPTNEHLFVANRGFLGTSSVASFRIDQSGMLSPALGTNVIVGDDFFGLDVVRVEVPVPAN